MRLVFLWVGLSLGRERELFPVSLTELEEKEAGRRKREGRGNKPQSFYLSSSWYLDGVDWGSYSATTRKSLLQIHMLREHKEATGLRNVSRGAERANQPPWAAYGPLRSPFPQREAAHRMSQGRARVAKTSAVRGFQTHDFSPVHKSKFITPRHRRELFP